MGRQIQVDRGNNAQDELSFVVVYEILKKSPKWAVVGGGDH